MLVVDEDAYDFHIDARPGYKASAMKTVLDAARSRGLEPLDEDECEPELLEDGTVRIYLAPITVYAVQPVIQERPARSIAKRAAGTFALAACVAGALILPSPALHSRDNYRDAVKEVFTPGHKDTTPDLVPMSTPSPNEGELSGPESRRDPAGEAPAPEHVRPTGRMEQTADRSRGRRQAEGAHTHHHVHRLHRGQVELDRLARAHGVARFFAQARLAGASAQPGPGRHRRQEATERFDRAGQGRGRSEREVAQGHVFA
jgi:hypothetical protein